VANSTSSRTWLDRALALVERTGNALPHPATLFFLATVLVVTASAVVSWLE